MGGGDKKREREKGEDEGSRKKAKKEDKGEGKKEEVKEKKEEKVDLLELCEVQRPFAIPIAVPMAKAKDTAKIFRLIGKGDEGENRMNQSEN